MTDSLATQAIVRQELEITFDLAAHRLSGRSLITVPAQTAAAINLSGLEITSLELNGAPIPPTTELTLPPGEKKRQLIVTFQKRGNNFEGLIASDGISLTGVWHPLANGPCLYQLTAVVPKHFTAISEAEEISEAANGETRTFSFRFAHPLEGLNFVAGPYVVEQEPFGNGQTLYSYFFPEDRQLAAQYREKALAYLKRYQELLGPYPYQRFSVVENRLPTGYAMPTFTLLGQAVVRLPFITETSLGHEVLHSWFGNAVGVEADQGNWSEGLTTYLADQTFAAEAGNGPAFRKQQLINYQSFVGPDTPMALKDFRGAGSHLDPGNKAARTVGYDRASMFFHMLFKEIGDVPFYAGLRDFYTRFRHRQASWQDMIVCFSRSANRNLAPFFSQWLNRPDLPRLNISASPLSENEGQVELTLTIKQAQEQPYLLRLPLEIITPTGKERREVTLTGNETKLSLRLTDYPSLVIADPDYDLLRPLATEEMPPAWSRFLGARDKLAIVGADEDQRLLAPLVELLSALDCPFREADSVNDQDLANKSVLFLGTGSRLARSLFAVQPQTSGFSLETMENPLAPGQVAVLVSSASAEETAAAGPKLTHYGKYGSLLFSRGKIVGKAIKDSEQGIRLPIDLPPQGLALPQALPFAAIMDRLADRQVVLVGETHTRYEDHLLQLRVIRALHRQNPRLAIGMEMFNRQTQPVLDRYLAGELNEREFLKQSGYFSQWGYDYRLYREIINFARRHRLPIVALNQDKAIVAKVYREGTSTLTSEELSRIPADRDLSIPGYREKITEVFTMHNRQGDVQNRRNGFLQAQAIWDETMAESVAEFLKANPDTRMVVLAGRGHTDKGTAIPPRLARRLPGIHQAVLINGEGGELEPAEADYLLFSKAVALPQAAMLGVVLSNTPAGPQVKELTEKSKAGAAGVREKDVILALDDEPVSDTDDLKAILLGKETGKRVTVKIKRESGLWFKSEDTLVIPVDL